MERLNEEKGHEIERKEGRKKDRNYDGSLRGGGKECNAVITCK